MTPFDIETAARGAWSEPGLPWWYNYAHEAVLAGRWWTIHRHDSDVYLARFWISEPRRDEAKASVGDCPFDVENSVMLHLFLRPDDDESLHDHPSPFTTTLLQGEYVEARPSPGWDRESGLGPCPSNNLLHWPAGSVIRRKADDLHAIVRLKTNIVWTLVRTGARERPWGFWPEGKPWMAAKEYIKDHP